MWWREDQERARQGDTGEATPTYILDSLSNNDVTFFMPPYRRNYEWSTDPC